MQPALPSSSTAGLFALDRSSQEVKDAICMLVKWQLPSTDENLRKYLILKRQQAGSDTPGRITKGKLLAMSISSTREEALTRKLYVVPRINPGEPDVDRFLKNLPSRYIVEPELLLSLPAGIDPQAVVFVTANVDCTKLGSRQLIHTTAVRNLAAMPDSSPGSAGDNALPPLAGVAPPSLTPPGSAGGDQHPTPPAEGEPQAKQPRLLLTRTSEEGSVRAEFEMIAQRTMRAASSGQD